MLRFSDSHLRFARDVSCFMLFFEENEQGHFSLCSARISQLLITVYALVTNNFSYEEMNDLRVSMIIHLSSASIIIIQSVGTV